MNDPGRYRLSAADLDRRWPIVRELLLPASSPAERDPALLIVGAQPGAGKTQAARSVIAHAYPGRSFALLDSDALRPAHPAFAQIMAIDPLRMPVLTNQAASAWLQRGIVEARQERISVVVENTFTRAATLIEEATRFRQAGYRVHVVVLAVPAAISALATVDRFLRTPGGDGPRWTTAAAHNSAYTAIPDTLRRVIDSGVTDRVTVRDRDQALYDGSDRDQALAALSAGRDRPLTGSEWEDYRSTYQDVRRALVLRGTAAGPYAAGVVAALDRDALALGVTPPANLAALDDAARASRPASHTRPPGEARTAEPPGQTRMPPGVPNGPTRGLDR